MALQVPLLYEDDSLILVNKPAGIPVIPARHSKDGHCLRAVLEKTYGKLWVVHRLDAETSGVLCMARHADAHRALSLQFQNRQVEKYYHALLLGIPSPREGTIDRPIGPHPTVAGKMMITARGKPARSRYRVLETMGRYGLVEVEIETGRTHQIRVHLQYLGCPLLVDPLYGQAEAFFLSSVKGKGYKRGKDREERPLLSRLSLHAYQLRLAHPLRGAALRVEAPYPKDMRAVLTQLRKWAR